MQPASGKAKVGRRRIACIACSANKQKCDGNLRYPCKRCELYGAECSYPNGEVPKTAVRVDAPSTSGAPTSSATSSTTTRSAAPASTLEGGDQDIAAAIRDMTARIAAIEAGLEADRRTGVRAAPSSSSFPLPAPPAASHPDPQASSSTAAAGSASASESATAHGRHLDFAADVNPLQVLVSTMEQMSRDEQAMSDAEGEDEEDAAEGDEPREDPESLSYLEQLAWKARSEPRSARCDAFARGLATLEDVDAAFGFYTQRIQPWIPVVERRPALVVREKSPFFFHVILLVTNYYNTSTTTRAREVYAGLNAIVHELLVQHVLAPDPSLLSRDFVRALLLLLYYKPVQQVYAERGLKSTSRIVHASKVNALSSLMIHALIRQATSFLGIHQAPLALTSCLDARPPAGAARERTLSDFRTWCTIIAADALGSLQSGRMSWTDPSAALKVARRFASLASDPTDVRRAAVLELYSTVTVPPSVAASTNPVRYRLDQLVQINAKLDEATRYWMPILAEAQKKGDPLAYTVVQAQAQFVILAVNGAVYTRWDLERKKELEEGKEGRPTLTSEDWQHLQRAAQAAEAATFVPAVEAGATGHPLRECRWPEPVNGNRGALHLDPRITEDFKTALDTMTCIAFVYSLLFLVRMASAGLMTCDLETRQADYEAGCDLSTPEALAAGTKLPRLLELGAKFLTGISPNPDHPARRHALLIETILRVGLSATSPQAQSASSPASGRRDKRSSIPSVALAAAMQAAQPGRAKYPVPPQNSGQTPLHPASVPGVLPIPPQLQQQQQQPPLPPPQHLQQNAVSRPSIHSFDSWLWDTNAPSAATLSGPLRMQDGSFVMPDLTGGAVASTPSPAALEQLGAGGGGIGSGGHNATGSGGGGGSGSGSTDRNAALAMVASAGRNGDAAQAMASLLSEVNPFLDDFYASQPSLGLGSHAFNDDFGLGAAGGGGNGLDGFGMGMMGGMEWATVAGSGGGEGAGAPFAGAQGAPEGAWPYPPGGS
ncbi:hypothetical protein JCM11641_008164 [Rhodosporidiobolus odoratus]